MEMQIKIHTWKDLEESREVIERLVDENLNTKLDNYLQRFSNKSDVEGITELHADKNKKGLFDAKLQVSIDGNSYRYEREDYKNLDDLINHLFDHFKEELARK